MFKKTILKILKSIIAFGMTKLFNLADKDKNGELSKEEIHGAIDEIRNLATKIIKKIK